MDAPRPTQLTPRMFSQTPLPTPEAAPLCASATADIGAPAGGGKETAWHGPVRAVKAEGACWLMKTSPRLRPEEVCCPAPSIATATADGETV